MPGPDPGARRYPAPPAQVAPYVDAMGQRLAVRFLLVFGGAELYIAREPGSRSQLVKLIGQEKAAELAKKDHLLQRRIPLAKPWIAAVLRADGCSVAQIARTLRVSDVTVRKMLKARRDAGADP